MDVTPICENITTSLRVRYSTDDVSAPYTSNYNGHYRFHIVILRADHKRFVFDGPSVIGIREALVALATMLGLAPDGTDPTAALRAFAVDHAKRCRDCDNPATGYFRNPVTRNVEYVCDSASCATVMWVTCASCGKDAVDDITSECEHCGGTEHERHTAMQWAKELPHAALLRTLPRSGT